MSAVCAVFAVCMRCVQCVKFVCSVCSMCAVCVWCVQYVCCVYRVCSECRVQGSISSMLPSLYALDVEDVYDHGALGALLHEDKKLRGDGLEAGDLHRQERLDVCRAAARGKVAY